MSETSVQRLDPAPEVTRFGPSMHRDECLCPTSGGKEGDEEKGRKEERKQRGEGRVGAAGDPVSFSGWLSNGDLIVAGLQESR